MGKATPLSYPYYLYLFVDSDNLKFKFHSSDYLEEFHYYCRLGELTNSQYNRLEKWLGRFQETDRFVLDLTGKYINPLDGYSTYSMTRIKFKVARITKKTSGKLKRLIESGHDDFRRALERDRERILGDDYSPYRVLYEVRRKAAFFSGRAIDDAEPCQTSVTGGTSKPRNSSSPPPVSPAVTPPPGTKRGRPQSPRNVWVQKQHNARRKPAAIRDKWNALTEAERKEIDPVNHAIYDIEAKTTGGKSQALESIRNAIRNPIRHKRKPQKK